ncbi:MAG TPA: hypothetical protein VM223_18710 [Planctomycetota bacterium]|nr:hypothetical protein [Planctomycetota bacterium]
MTTDSVLVLGTGENLELRERLFDTGFAPLIRGTTSDVIKTLRRGQFAAIVVDADHVSVDLLEFVLNVRDVNADVPVLIIGGQPDPRTGKMLRSQQRIHMLRTTGRSPELARRLRRVLAMDPGRNRRGTSGCSSAG